MAKTVKELMELGLSEAEANRIINRAAKAEAKEAQAKALAEKRLPKCQADFDHASARVAHWTKVMHEAGEKVAKYTAIIAGDYVNDVDPEQLELPLEVPAKKAARKR